MDALTQKKLNEAKGFIAEAEKAMKTSLFKRKPDYDSAASAYSSAGTCYRTAKDLKKSVEMFKQSANCYQQMDSLYNAAKQYEQISLLASELKDYVLLADSIEKAADFMITSGTRDSAGVMLERGANMLKLNDPEKALRLYKKALHVSDVEDKHHEMVKFYENAIGLALKLNKYDEAIELINQCFGVLDRVGTNEQIIKYILTGVLIYLNKDDWVAAKGFVDRLRNKYDGGERGFSQIDNILEAFDEKDDDRFKAAIKNYLTYAVDNEALKLANKIVKTDEWIKATQEAKIQAKPAAPQKQQQQQQQQQQQPNSVSTEQVRVEVPPGHHRQEAASSTLEDFEADELNDMSSNPTIKPPANEDDEEEDEMDLR